MHTQAVLLEFPLSNPTLLSSSSESHESDCTNTEADLYLSCSENDIIHFLLTWSIKTFTFKALWVDSADDKWNRYLVLLFPENKVWHFMQIVSSGDNLQEISTLICREKKESKIFQNVICWCFPSMLSTNNCKKCMKPFHAVLELLHLGFPFRIILSRF